MVDHPEFKKPNNNGRVSTTNTDLKMYPLKNLLAPFSFRALEGDEKQRMPIFSLQQKSGKRTFNDFFAGDKGIDSESNGAKSVDGFYTEHPSVYKKVKKQSGLFGRGILQETLVKTNEVSLEKKAEELQLTPSVSLQNDEALTSNREVHMNDLSMNNFNTSHNPNNMSRIGNSVSSEVISSTAATALDSPPSDDILPLSPIPSPRELGMLQYEQLASHYTQQQSTNSDASSISNFNTDRDFLLAKSSSANSLDDAVKLFKKSLSRKDYRAFVFKLMQNFNKQELTDVGYVINQSLKSDFIDILPSELLIQILKSLHYQDIKHCMSINKKWYSLIQNSSTIWKNLMLKEGFIESEHFKKYCKSKKNPCDYKKDFLINQKYYENWINPNFKPNEIRMPGHVVSIITCLQFADDVVITGADDRMIHIYDAEKGQLVKELSGHEGGVWALTYHKETKLLVSGGTDRTVRVWNMETGCCTHIFRGHTSTVRCLDIFKHNNEYHIVSGSRDSTLHVWKLPDPKSESYNPQVTQNYPIPEFNEYFVGVLKGHTGSVRTLSGHGKIVISGSYDHTLRVWDISTMKCLYELVGHTHRIYSVLYDHKRNRCISSSMDFAIRVWDLANIGNNNVDGSLQNDTNESQHVLDLSKRIVGSWKTLQGHTGLVALLSMSEEMIISAASDGTIRGWDCDDYKPTFSYNHKGISAVTTFYMNNNILVSGSEIQFTVYNLRTKEVIHTDLLNDAEQIWSVKFDNKKLVAAIEINQKSAVVILDFSKETATKTVVPVHSAVSPLFSFGEGNHREIEMAIAPAESSTDGVDEHEQEEEVSAEEEQSEFNEYPRFSQNPATTQILENRASDFTPSNIVEGSAVAEIRPEIQTLQNTEGLSSGNDEADVISSGESDNNWTSDTAL
ncbi:hypothetical protein ACO0RG_003776 [Hanseniaspora osmophila]|uniref:Cell division control protein 4 n=1 Tax=Hanseniaspora osmophila TaxID=56408 RepID=A0A1E5REW5_9ASCO|nr:Cell division control protein 4 [Hanseniaspora osmophila]